MTTDFWQGLVVGLFLGCATGILLAKSYVLLKQAVREWREKETKMRPLQFIRRFIGWIAHQPYERTLLTLLAVVLIGVGIFQVISAGRFTSYVNCQAQYNQDSGEVRDARLKPSSQELNKLFKWVESVRPLIQDPGTGEPTEAQRLHRIQRFTKTLDEAIAAHQAKIAVQKANQYPELPANACGGELK